MPENPDAEWRRLCETYAAMCDEEILELAADFNDLTEIAQLTLRDEMKKRRLGDPVPRSVCGPAAADSTRSNLALENAEADAAKRAEYSWKVLFRETDSREGADQMRMALVRENIECWVETRPLSGLSRLLGAADPADRVLYRVLVAADQADQAAAVLSVPIPGDIADASGQEVPDYVIPCCPKCGAVDPVLESADPQNSWHCESCDHNWTESEAVLIPDEAAKKP